MKAQNPWKTITGAASAALALFLIASAKPTASPTHAPVGSMETVARVNPPAPPALPRPEPVSVGTAVPQTVATVPQRLAQATELSRKVLPSSADRSTLEAAWASAPLLQLTRDRLMDLSQAAQTPEAQKERMRLIEYLEAAAGWSRNPLRAEVLDTLSQILERDVTRLEAPLELRRSLAGDVIELYTVLYEVEPERAEDLYHRVSPEQQRLFRFGKNMVLHARKGTNEQREGT